MDQSHVRQSNRFAGEFNPKTGIETDDLTQSFGHLRFARGLGVLLEYTLTARRVSKKIAVTGGHRP